LIPVFPVCGSDGVHELAILPPINSDENAKSTPSELANSFGKILGSMISRHPDHYNLLVMEAKFRSKLDPIKKFVKR